MKRLSLQVGFLGLVAMLILAGLATALASGGADAPEWCEFDAEAVAWSCLTPVAQQRARQGASLDPESVNPEGYPQLRLFEANREIMASFVATPQRIVVLLFNYSLYPHEKDCHPRVKTLPEKAHLSVVGDGQPFRFPLRRVSPSMMAIGIPKTWFQQFSDLDLDFHSEDRQGITLIEAEAQQFVSRHL